MWGRGRNIEQFSGRVETQAPPTLLSVPENVRSFDHDPTRPSGEKNGAAAPTGSREPQLRSFSRAAVWGRGRNIEQFPGR
eukprot:5898571-Alexandrium_andersonii.AAC.1